MRPHPYVPCGQTNSSLNSPLCWPHFAKVLFKYTVDMEDWSLELLKLPPGFFLPPYKEIQAITLGCTDLAIYRFF